MKEELRTPAGIRTYRLEPIVRFGGDGRFEGVYAYEILSSPRPPASPEEDIERFESFVEGVRAGAPLHVNLHPHTLVLYEDRVKRAIGRVDEAAGVVVELVESGVPEEGFEEAVARIGTRVSIDDFGSGRSNFDRLFAITAVESAKVDRHLWALEGSDRLIAELVDFLDSRGIGAIAEKVEDERELRRLFGLGFRLFQGYLFEPGGRTASIRAEEREA